MTIRRPSVSLVPPPATQAHRTSLGLIGQPNAICEINGDIDLMADPPSFVMALRSATDHAHTTDVILDCRAVTFLGTAALHALLDAHRYAIQQGHRLVIRNLSASCDRLVRMSDQNNELVIESFAISFRRPTFSSLPPP